MSKGYGVVEKDMYDQLESHAAHLEAELVRLREVERKAIEQSEYIQAHGLTEYEFGLLRSELATVQEKLEIAEGLNVACGLVIKNQNDRIAAAIRELKQD